MAVLDKYLYIEGGRVSDYINGVLKNNGGDKYFSGIGSTYATFLASSWDNATMDRVLSSRGNRLTIDTPALWVDEEGGVLYCWGGRDTLDQPLSSLDEDQTPSLWRFTPDRGGGGQWEATGGPPPGLGSGDDIVYAVTQGAWGTCGGKGLVAGGMASPATDGRLGGRPTAEPGLVIYDLNTSTWEKESTAPLNWPDGTLINAAGVCLSSSDDHLALNPLFFVIGGTKRSATTIEERTIRSFNNITFFDIETRTWHWQEAKGDVPRSREYFCAAGQNGNNGTYEMYEHLPSPPPY